MQQADHPPATGTDGLRTTSLSPRPEWMPVRGRHNGHDMPEPLITQVPVCELCLEGKGSECHVPGCVYWMHAVPPKGTFPASPMMEAVRVDRRAG